MNNQPGKQLSMAELTRLWKDPNVTCVDIANMCGVLPSAISERAKIRGLGRKIMKNPGVETVIADPRFPEFWKQKVILKDLCQRYGVTVATLRKSARHLGLKRPRVGRTAVRPLVLVEMEIQAREMAAYHRELEREESRRLPNTWERRKL